MPAFDRLGNARMRQAFHELNLLGIATHADYACCDACALDDLETKHRTLHSAMRGFCFYTGTEADLLAQTGECSLTFGVFGARELDAELQGELRREVAQLIVERLREHEIGATWSGRDDLRIQMRVYAQ